MQSSTTPREPSVLPPALPPQRFTVAQLTWRKGPWCPKCQGLGFDELAHSQGYGFHPCSCAEDRFGDIVCRGATCPGLDGDPCAAGEHPERMGDGGFELPSGKHVCRACAAIACGYRGYDDRDDLDVLNALDAAERAS